MQRAKHHNERVSFRTSQTNAPRSSKRDKTDRGEDEMPHLKVSIQFYIDPIMLQKINDNINGKTQSERIRLCVQEGYDVLRKRN
jgi:hypothetical protein